MDINIPTIILQTIGLLLLIYFLKRACYKHILSFLDARIDQTNKLINQTEDNHRKSEDLVLDAKKQLEQAKKETIEIRDLAKSTGLKEREEIIGKSKIEAENMINKTQSELKGEIEKTKQSLKVFIVEFSMKIAEKVLMREMSREDRKRYIKMYTKEVEEIYERDAMS